MSRWNDDQTAGTRRRSGVRKGDVPVLTLTPQLHINKNNNYRRLKKSIKDTFLEDLNMDLVKVSNGQDSSS